MASRRPFIRALRQCKRLRLSETSFTSRPFSAYSRRQTDGVFRELTNQRVEMPWIEALRMQQHGGDGQSNLATTTTTSPPSSQRDLEPKRMKDSYHSVVRTPDELDSNVALLQNLTCERQVIPLGRDPWLLDTYANSSGHIRLGTIFMDLDALSGVIAYKHTGDAVTTVTAAFDRITINHALSEICDLELSGMVTHTGKSSMEISLQVAKAPAEGQAIKPEDVMITCQCTMVSLDPATKKPVQISPLLIETPEEKRLFEQGEKNSKRRKALAQRSLLKETPDDEESDLIHSMWQRQLKYHDPNDPMRKPDSVHFMDSTRLNAASIMQPQYRNRHHFMIFGGFLLKQTFELAFCCAASFARARPTFVSLDPSTFQNPVPVGSVLYLSATVVYTDPPLVRGASDKNDMDSPHVENTQTRVQVRVDSKVRNIEHGHTKPTGQFNYTFTVDRDIKVMPRTYSEYMMYLDARRRVKGALESIEEGDADPGVKERVTE